MKYPGTILNCAKCHNTVAQADNWKNKPTKTACDSCHTTIKFDNTDYLGIKSTSTVTVAGQLHTESDNANCSACHNAAKMATDHTPATSKDETLRAISATISGVTISAGDGGVTVAFSVQENGAAKTDLTATSALSLTLAKLVPSTPGTPSYWQSYLSKARTKDAAKSPVVQGRNETGADGSILTNNGDGTYTYKFKLLNSDVFLPTSRPSRSLILYRPAIPPKPAISSTATAATNATARPPSMPGLPLNIALAAIIRTALIRSPASLPRR